MDEDAIEALRALLKEPESHVRLSAATALLEHSRFLDAQRVATYRRCGCR